MKDLISVLDGGSYHGSYRHKPVNCILKLEQIL